MKVFIVEDSALMYARIAQAVKAIRGLSVTGAASDAKGALTAIRELSPDALIVDIQLREGSGLDVLKQIKSERPEIKTLVLSNSATLPYQHAAVVAGADYFLDKSTEFGQLAGILKKWAALPSVLAPIDSPTTH
jgi:two-component system, NarL family, response regulator DevR